MKFVSVRELRGRTAEVWRRLGKERELVITCNGKPIGILSATDELLTFVESMGEFVTPSPAGAVLPDVDDLMFLETALALKADFVLTGNPRHFPESERL
jgi:predicted nucleic acid-binding protein